MNRKRRDQKLRSSHKEIEQNVFKPPRGVSRQAYIKSQREYERLYQESVRHPEKFWARQAAEHLHWFKKWKKVMAYDFSRIGEAETPYCQFFIGGKLNVSDNCLDRHVSSWRRNKAAIVWVGEAEGEQRTITYQQLYTEVCRLANVLKKHGVKRGDRVMIFLPMIPELPMALLACARIGAIHSVVFSAFSAEALKERTLDCDATMVITADVGFHGGKVIPLKAKVDEALRSCPRVKKVLVYRWSRGKAKNDGGMETFSGMKAGRDARDPEHTQAQMTPGRDFWWHEEIASPQAQPDCPPEVMDAEDPLFILYTSGSTGKPKGVLHTTAGYSLYAHLTCKWIFDLKDEDLFWCTADIGWVTGHSYIVYGPLSNGTTVLMYEGIPTYPQPDRFWQIIEQHRVSVFYTAPTAIRALMRLGDAWPSRHDLSSLRILGSVGEPINPAAWLWYYRVIGGGRCPLMDTWWQTETGGIMITPLPGAIPTKPGSASKPFFGVVPEILREDGSKAGVNEKGYLVITQPWPGMLRGVYGDQTNESIRRIYFSRFPRKYFTGDGCLMDQDGFYWLQGRMDDVLNVAGHRLSTAEIEHALVSHETVAETAVVGYPHELKGQGIYCFVTLKDSQNPSDHLEQTLRDHVRQRISPIATPDKIQFTDVLPKTRSGKIMRRILRKIAEGDIGSLGDTSTLADPSVVDALVNGRK